MANPLARLLAADLNNNGNKWDFWGRLLSPLLAFAPHNPTNGNHEIEAVNVSLPVYVYPSGCARPCKHCRQPWS